MINMNGVSRPSATGNQRDNRLRVAATRALLPRTIATVEKAQPENGHDRLANGPSIKRYYGASRDGDLYASESALKPEQEALCRMLARIARRLHSGRSRGHLRIVK